MISCDMISLSFVGARSFVVCSWGFCFGARLVSLESCQRMQARLCEPFSVGRGLGASIAVLVLSRSQRGSLEYGGIGCNSAAWTI